MADECRIYFENVRKLGILKKFTEATAEKAIKYCIKWITIAGFRQKVCESVLDQVDAGKSLPWLASVIILADKTFEAKKTRSQSSSLFSSYKKPRKETLRIP